MADLSTLGVLFGYGVESTAGEKPTAFTQIPRCKSIGGIELSQENIDVSCLEDEISRYVKGRQDTGGEWSVTFLTGAIQALKTVFTSYKALSDGKRMWFEVWIPDLEDAFYVVAQPGSNIPLPEISDNSALEIPITLTIEEYIGLDTAIKPTEAVVTSK